MIFDKENMFSNKQTVTTGSDSGVLSANVIDLGVAGQDIGAGKQLYVCIQVDTTLAGAGDTCDVELVSDSVSTLNDSLTVHQILTTFPATAPAGTRRAIPIAPAASGSPFERYLGLRYYARGSGALEAGAFSAFLTDNLDTAKAYADAVTIS